MKKQRNIQAIHWVILLLSYCLTNMAYSQARLRPADWGNKVIGTSLDNLYQMDKGVYRSNQPSDDAFIELKEMGIQEVLNLRRYHSDDDEAKGLGLRLHHLKLNAGSINEDHLIRALKIIKNRTGPIVFHCWHGSDRTGAVAAAYRVIFNGWSKQQAIDELVNGGYGYHARIYGNIIDLIESMDVKHMKFHLNEP